MFNTEFLSTPSGVLWLSIILIAIIAQLATTQRALHESSRIQRAMLASAKKRSLRQVTVVIDLRRRAESIFDLLDHLIAHHYNRLDVVVIVRSTAGKNARAVLEEYRRTTELKKLSIVTFRRGTTESALATQYAKGTVLLKLDSDMRLSDRFFEKISYGFTAAGSALLVRRYLRPGRTLMSGWRSLSSLWRGLIVPYLNSRQRTARTGLVSGMPVLKSVLKKDLPYTADTLLFDEYGLDMTTTSLASRSYTWPVRLIIIALFLLLIGFIVYLLETTPRELLSFISWLIFGVYIISSLTLLSSLQGLGRLERFLVYALIPFYPLYLVYLAIANVIEPGPKGSRPLKQPVQPVTR